MTIEQITTPSALVAEMEYARTVSSASMLPDAYRGKPADIMLAIGLGQSMGLSPAESLYRIAVIKGKPTASAELIASNVRKAGHRLRTTIAEDGQSATCSIWRADDPEFEHRVTRDLAWAQSMGLATNDNYRKQLATMLANRAITACARLACPEALYGVAYTSDEMGDFPATSAPAPSTSADRLRAALHVEQVPNDPAPTPAADPDPEPITSAQQKKIGATMRDLGITERWFALLYVSDVIGREIGSRNELTKAEAGQVIEALERDLADAQGADA